MVHHGQVWNYSNTVRLKIMANSEVLSVIIILQVYKILRADHKTQLLSL